MHTFRRIERFATNPPGSAFILSIVYIILCGTYVWLSSHVAAISADSLESLERIERMKGTLFILATGLLFFVFAYILLRHIANQSNTLVQQNNALIISDRRAMAGAFAVSVAHDMNNQIMVLRSGMEEIVEDCRATAPDEVQYVQHALDDLTRLSRQLLDMGRNSMSEDLQPCHLMKIYTDVEQLAQRHQRTRSCTLRSSMPANLSASLKPSIISQMLFNLILNAADATDGSGIIEVRGYTQNDRIIIEVHDNGPGIPPELRAEVIKPFFTTKKTGHGLGFMSVVACAEVHEGKVEIMESDLKGACIRISLPVIQITNRTDQLAAPQLLQKA